VAGLIDLADVQDMEAEHAALNMLLSKHRL